MTLKTLVLGCVAALALGAAQASAQIVNGGFEDGDFTGWTVSNPGQSAVLDSADSAEDGPYAPTEGEKLAQLVAGSGQGSGFYNTISQTFLLEGFGRLFGDAAFFAYDFGGPFNDDGYVKIYREETETTTFALFPLTPFFSSVNAVGEFNATPWTHFRVTLAPGTYTLVAGVRNQGDDGFSSHLVLDNVGVGGVPEPATWAMLIAGFCLAGATLRRRRAALV